MEEQAHSDAWQPGLYLLGEFTAPIPFSPDPHPTRPRDPVAALEDTEAICFICKTPLFRSQTPNAGNYTKEDVFPRWLVEHFELDSDVLDYPGGTFKRYKKILVPCCQPCNNAWMSAVEGRIRDAAKSADQYAAFKTLSRSDLALWTIKIMYGLLYTRIAPWNFDKHKPRPPEITDAVLDHFRLSLMLLDGFRKRIILSGAPFPSSILILRIKPGTTGRLAFDYQDSIEFPTAIAMRMGTVGLIATFEDFGTVENFFEKEFAPLIGANALHPIQFMEIAARAFEMAGLGVHDVAYSAMEGPRDVHLHLKPRLAHCLDPDHARLHQRIAAMTGDAEFVNRPPGMTTMLDKSGGFLELPWPPPATHVPSTG